MPHRGNRVCGIVEITFDGYGLDLSLRKLQRKQISRLVVVLELDSRGGVCGITAAAPLYCCSKAAFMRAGSGGT